MSLSSELIYLIFTAANTPELGEDPYEDLLASVAAEIESGLYTEYDKIEEFRDELELAERQPLSLELIHLIWLVTQFPDELGEDPYEVLLPAVEAEIAGGVSEEDKIEEFRDELELVEIVEVQAGLLFMCDLSLERRARSGFHVDMIIVKSPSAFDHAPPKNWDIQYGVPTDPVLN